MGKTLCSVGIDVGTTTTQLVVSELTVENRASGFAVPQMEITGRKLLYCSPVFFTPLLQGDLVDGEKLRSLVADAYAKAGISPETVDTGAIIITGETSRKENARAVLRALAGFAGEFVAATAGPDLESVLAATGAGAVELSQKTGKPVLHMDIGGGTSNLALVRDGKILQTGCLNVGGRLIKLDTAGRITYLSPVLRPLTQLQVGQKVPPEELARIAGLLVQGLEMAAGLREKTPLWEALITGEAPHTQPAEPGAVLSFSGGVADCIQKDHPALAFGDMGPLLGKAIRESRLCRGEYHLGQHTIRATVIGAGCHSASLSGSTVFYRNIDLPMKDLPVAALNCDEQYDPLAIQNRLRPFDTSQVVLALPGEKQPDRAAVERLAQAVVEGVGQRPVLVCLEADMAKALGHCLCLRLPPDRPCLCIDRLRLPEASYLDVGQPVGPALPVVIKTLILSR